jgi:hypothetical protein
MDIIQNLPFLESTMLTHIEPKTVPQLMSAARAEFICNSDYTATYHDSGDLIVNGRFDLDGIFMEMLTNLFVAIAHELYDTTYIWSNYNKGQWHKFVMCRIGNEGGACMFSLENNGKTIPDNPLGYTTDLIG